MRRFLSALCATAMAFSIGGTAAFPVNAAPIHVIAPAQPDGQIVNVRDRDPGRRYSGRHYYRGGRHWGDRRYYRSSRYRDYARRGDYRYYRGYRGYRHKRHGYRYYDGWWFPAGAFVAGAIIGGALSQPPRVEYRTSLSSAHVRWCYGRYRSYRAYDNTFQPYHGPRKQCYSPYY